MIEITDKDLDKFILIETLIMTMKKKKKIEISCRLIGSSTNWRLSKV